MGGQVGRKEPASMPLYARATGGSTPPLLMNPDPAWTVKFFTKVGQRGLLVKLPAPVVAIRSSDGTALDPDALLGDVGLLPYEMLEFRTATDK
jgi:hypothetical protein